MTTRPSFRLSSLAVSLAIVSLSLAQTPPPAGTAQAPKSPEVAKKTLSPADYGKWEVLGEWTLSNDGRWIAAQIGTTEGDQGLLLKNNDTPQQIRRDYAFGASFSDDSKFAGFLTGVSRAAGLKLREERKPIEAKFTLIRLESGQEVSWDNVARFLFLKGGKTLLIHRNRPLGPEPTAQSGSDLIIVDLASGAQFVVGNALDATPSNDGLRIAVTIRSESGEGGLQLIDPNSFRVNQVAWGKEPIRNVTWSKDNNTLAYLTGRSDEKKEGDQHRITLVTGLRSELRLAVLEPTAPDSGIPEGWRISETAPLELADDGQSVGFGAQPWKNKKKPTRPGEKAGVEVWNTKDLRTLPEQRVQAPADQARTDVFYWQPGSKAVQLTKPYNDTGDGENGQLLTGNKHALIVDEKPYASAVSNGFAYYDVYIVNAKTAERTQVLSKTHWLPIPSPEGKYLAYYRQRNWWLYDIEKGTHRNATGDLKTTFEDEEDDHTVPEKRPVDPPTWLAADAGFIVEDKYDAYLVRAGSSSITPLTNGRKDRLIHRFTRIDSNEDGAKITEPLWFSITDEDTVAKGYYVADATGKGKIAVLDNSLIGGLRKARDGDRVAFRLETFDKSPSLLVTNQAFSQMKPTVRTNPQQALFKWGKAELINFKSRWGLPLKGTLVYPADYDPKRSYPMITYIYERLSNRFHAYIPPAEQSSYNAQVLSQNGYFVFMPDIAYKGRNPGKSAQDCLEPAVAAVLARRVGVDPDRVGLMGHSWGGYQTAFVTTVSKTFKVGVAGAPLTELTSMYNTHYWNSGIVNAPLLETGQGRLEVPFWEDPKVYIENSPVWRSQERKSPLLIACGDKDGAVDYHQGIALYNTLRRMGKDAVLLVYAGENHNFTQRPNQLDYARRLRHFLDVHLKGAKPESWITDGIPFLKKDD